VERTEVMQLLRDKAEALLGLDPDEVQEDRTFVGDLGVESLALIEYVMDIEDALGIELPEEQVTDAPTVGAFLDLVMDQLATALNRDG
jgi:acyl carrier protein